MSESFDAPSRAVACDSSVEMQVALTPLLSRALQLRLVVRVGTPAALVESVRTTVHDNL
jgi:hypothetical protein